MPGEIIKWSAAIAAIFFCLQLFASLLQSVFRGPSEHRSPLNIAVDHFMVSAALIPLAIAEAIKRPGKQAPFMIAMVLIVGLGALFGALSSDQPLAPLSVILAITGVVVLLVLLINIVRRDSE